MIRFLILNLVLSYSLYAEELPLVTLRFKDHKFDIEHIELKANQRYKFKVYNDDSMSEEFESRSMIVEKFIAPKKAINFILGPFRPGTYEFFGCFHPSTAKGKVVVK
jgi:hypothetical protein